MEFKEFKYCPLCATELVTQPLFGRERRRCPNCGWIHFRDPKVGAGALVTGGKKFPPRSLIIGSPAKVVRELSDEEVAELYASAKRYVAFKNDYIDHIR